MEEAIKQLHSWINLFTRRKLLLLRNSVVQVYKKIFCLWLALLVSIDFADLAWDVTLLHYVYTLQNWFDRDWFIHDWQFQLLGIFSVL